MDTIGERVFRKHFDCHSGVRSHVHELLNNPHGIAGQQQHMQELKLFPAIRIKLPEHQIPYKPDKLLIVRWWHWNAAQCRNVTLLHFLFPWATFRAFRIGSKRKSLIAFIAFIAFIALATMPIAARANLNQNLRTAPNAIRFLAHASSMLQGMSSVPREPCLTKGFESQHSSVVRKTVWKSIYRQPFPLVVIPNRLQKLTHHCCSQDRAKIASADHSLH